ncbi:MAG: hypothetical protein JWQ74_3743 [Marmoricola sp.]|nr:hypothetical protein [Marmoricola sp.]
MPSFWISRRIEREANSIAWRPGVMGMSASAKDIDRAALDWLFRVNDPVFDDWEVWDQWMAEDPRHATAYWRLAENEGDAVEALRSAPVRSVSRLPAPVLAPPRLAAIAAAIAVLAVCGGIWFAAIPRAQPWTLETAPGEQRTVTLPDGSVVSLDGGTRLTLDRRAPRDVDLETGRALFRVVHDAARPFTVGVGHATLTDLGTVFDVTRLDDGVRVSVAEGQVRVDQDGASATLDPGDSVMATVRGLERRSVSSEDITGWTDGRLSYANERLPVVVQDLARTLNRPIVVSPALAGRRFSGSLATATAIDRQRLEALLGVTIVADGESWRLEPARTP